MRAPNSIHCSSDSSPNEAGASDPGEPAVTAVPAERGRDDAWIQRHQVPLWRFARLLGCAPDVADDLVQEALLAALHKRIPEEPDPRGAAWLRTAVSHLWQMHLRTESRRARHTGIAIAERAMRQCAAEDDGEGWLAALRVCLGAIDGRARRLLDLHYTTGASRNAIAGALGLQPEGVKTLLRRVRDALRQCILRRLEARSEARP